MAFFGEIASEFAMAIITDLAYSALDGLFDFDGNGDVLNAQQMQAILVEVLDAEAVANINEVWLALLQFMRTTYPQYLSTVHATCEPEGPSCLSPWDPNVVGTTGAANVFMSSRAFLQQQLADAQVFNTLTGVSNLWSIESMLLYASSSVDTNVPFAVSTFQSLVIMLGASIQCYRALAFCDTNGPNVSGTFPDNVAIPPGTITPPYLSMYIGTPGLLQHPRNTLLGDVQAHTIALASLWSDIETQYTNNAWNLTMNVYQNTQIYDPNAAVPNCFPSYEHGDGWTSNYWQTGAQFCPLVTDPSSAFCKASDAFPLDLHSSANSAIYQTGNNPETDNTVTYAQFEAVMQCLLSQLRVWAGNAPTVIEALGQCCGVSFPNGLDSAPTYVDSYPFGISNPSYATGCNASWSQFTTSPSPITPTYGFYCSALFPYTQGGTNDAFLTDADYPYANGPLCSQGKLYYQSCLAPTFAPGIYNNETNVGTATPQSRYVFCTDDASGNNPVPATASSSKRYYKHKT